MANPADPDDVVVNVGFDVDTADLAKVRAAIQSIDTVMGKWQKQMADTDKVQDKLKKNVSDLDNRTKRLHKSFDGLTNVLRRFMQFTKSYVLGSFKALGMAMKPAILGLAALGAGFAAAKLTVMTAVAGIKLWNMSIKAIPAAVAVALGALATFSAAITEVQAAAIAPFAGQSSASMNQFYQSLMGDPRLAALGTQSLMSTTSALVQAKVPLSQIRDVIKELGDYAFYAGGGDAAKGLESISQGLVSLSKNKTLTSGGLEAFAQQFGPMAENIEKAGKAFVGKDVQTFIEFLTSDPEQLKDFNNGLEESNNTLIGMFKGIKTLVQGALLPFGNQIMELLKGPLAGFREQLLEFINRVMPSVVSFFGQLLPKAFNALGNVLVWLDEKMQTVLPTFIDGFGQGLQTIGRFFTYLYDVGAAVAPLILKISDGFDILWRTILKPLLAGITGLFGGLLSHMTDFFRANEAGMSRIGDFITRVFQPDGVIVQTLRNAWAALSIVVQALGPALLKAADLLKSPIYLFELIKKNEDNINAFGRGVESFVDNALTPFISLVVDAFAWLLTQGPAIGEIFAQVGSILNPIIELGRALLGALDSLGGIKTIITFLISAKVLGGLRAMAATMAAAGASMGVSGSAAGGRFLAGRAGGAMLAGGTLATTYGLMNPTSTMGTLATIGGMTATGALVGSTFGPVGTAVGAGLGLVGGSVMAFFNRRAAERRELQELQNNRRMLGYSRAESMYGDSITTSSSLNGSSYQQYLAIQSDMSRNAELIANATYVLGGASGMMDIVRSDGSGIEATDVIGQNFRDMFLRDYNVRIGEGDTFAGLESWAEGQLDFLNDQMEISSELSEKFGTNIEHLNKYFEIGTGSAEEINRAVLELTDSLGLDLTQSFDTLEGALVALDAVISQMPSVAQIASSAFASIYGVTESVQFENEIASLGDRLREGLFDLDVTGLEGVDVDAATNEFIRTNLESIPREIERRIASGEIDTAEATTIAGDMINQVLSAFDPEKDEKYMNTISGYGQEIFDAITVTQNQIDAQEAIIDGYIDNIGTEFGIMSDAVIGGLRTKTQEYLATLGIYLPGAGSDGRSPNDPTGDSASPASNLLRTMGSHYSIDSMVSGKRMITSGWRNYNLGSSNSDHVTGRALDVVGDNLGSYASLMRAAGGFAEFHGTGSGRHLHVVPPIGDTPVPRPPAPASPRQNNGPVATSSNSITVNPSQGMNETALAMKIVREINRLNQDMMERR